MMKKIGILIVLLSAFIIGYSQKNVIQLPADSTFVPKNEHFVYFLPKTAIKVIVTVDKNQEIKGIYSDYAEKLLGVSNIFNQSRTYYTISKIEVQDYQIPDTKFQFLVELSKKQVQSDFYHQILIKNQMFNNNSKPFINAPSDPIPFFLKYYSDVKLLEKEESYVETRIVDGVLTQVPVSKTKTITKSLDQQAQEAADFISKIRKDRYNIFTASHEVAFTKESLEYMISNLDQLEKNYLELFTGTTLVQSEKIEIMIIPEDLNNLVIPVFSFSENEGLLPIDLKNKDQLYTIHLVPQVPIQQINKQETDWLQKKSKKTGYQYREAVPFEITLTNKNINTHHFGIFPIYQFSFLRTLPCGSDQFMISKFAFIY